MGNIVNVFQLSPPPFFFVLFTDYALRPNTFHIHMLLTVQFGIMFSYSKTHPGTR